MSEWPRPTGRIRSAPGSTATAPGAAVTTMPEAPTEPVARRGPRRARLSVRRIDPWSVLKFTFVYSLALAIVTVVAVAVLYLVLDTMGVFDSVDTVVRDFTASADSPGLTDLFSFRRIVGGALVLGAVNVVIITALATLGAWMYNLCADIVGGIDVTLTERQ